MSTTIKFTERYGAMMIGSKIIEGDTVGNHLGSIVGQSFTAPAKKGIYSWIPEDFDVTTTGITKEALEDHLWPTPKEEPFKIETTQDVKIMKPLTFKRKSE